MADGSYTREPGYGAEEHVDIRISAAGRAATCNRRAHRAVDTTASASLLRTHGATVHGVLNLRFGLPIAPICGALAIMLPLLAIARENEAQRGLDRARTAAQELDLATLGAVNAETGERGYTITGNTSFLDSYTSGREQFDASVANLRALGLGSGIEDEIDAMVAAYDHWLINWAEPQVQLVRAGGLGAARVRTGSGIGVDLFGTLRSKSDELGASIDQVVRDQKAEYDNRNVQTDVFVLFGGVAAAIAAALVIAGGRARWQAMHHLRAARAELERERELGRRRADVLASVSHDLRSPLAGVVLQASILEEQAEEDGKPDLVATAQEVSRGATRAALLVDELLDFARLESGAMQLEIVPLELCGVVKEAVEDVRIARPSFAPEICDETGDELVPGDEERLRAVFRNVLENAARYGKAPVRVRLLPVDKRMEVHIEDSGAGIPEAERSSVFRKYQRGSTAGGNKGTGLGLYFSRELVLLHGGSMDIAWSPLGGADFIISLPRAATPAGG